jgi:hypothetical protein
MLPPTTGGSISTDRPDEPLSSEEMLRRARHDLASDPDAATQEPEEGVTPEEGIQPEERPQPRRRAAEPAPFDGGPAENAATPAPASWHQPSPPVQGRPDEVVREPLPPLEPPPEGLPPSGPPPRRGILATLWRFRGLAVVIGIAVFIAISVLDTSKSVDRLEPGDCFDEPTALVFNEVDPVSCDEPHDYEVFALIEVTPATSSGIVPDLGLDVYPGDQAVYEGGALGCLDRFEDYVGSIWEESQIWLNVFTPTQEGWEDGDRTGICVLYQGSEQSVDKTTGSLRGSGR